MAYIDAETNRYTTYE